MLQDVPTTIPYGSDAWDSTQLMACVCDVGFFGSDCSQRRCATGDDPITTCPDTAFGGQVQEIKVTLGSELMHSLTSISGGSSEGMELFGVDSTKSFDVVREDESEAQVILGATDAYGQVYYAPTSAKAVFSKDSLARGGVDPGATSVEIALENIRNYRVDDVSVSAVQTGVHGADCSTATTATASCPYGKKSISILEKRYLVTFVPNELNSANFGKQNALVCKSGYSCPVSGCSPMVKMPFLYRYASSSSTTTGMDFSAVSGTTFSFYAGAALNSDTNFNAKSFIRLSDLSSPQLPMGMSPDSGVSASSASRYDIRVVVAVEDPEDANNGDSPVDVYWTKVVYGHVNIATDTNEYSGTTASGVWSASTGTYFTPTLLGFTYRGLIPTTLTASVPGAPGVELRFPDTNMVVDNKKYRFFEILVKLPSCSVTPLLTGAEFLGVNGQSLAPVDSRIENVECSNRGQCNRVSGLCECFSGFCACRGGAPPRLPPATRCLTSPLSPLLLPLSQNRRPLLRAHDNDGLKKI